jgi:hypothetical protein
MDLFFPFIYEPEQKKEFEPEYLYIEAIPLPPLEEKQEEEDPKVIIIEL